MVGLEILVVVGVIHLVMVGLEILVVVGVIHLVRVGLEVLVVAGLEDVWITPKLHVWIYPSVYASMENGPVDAMGAVKLTAMLTAGTLRMELVLVSAPPKMLVFLIA